MKIKNIKLKVETDEQNQYVLQKHLEVNKSCNWFVRLVYGFDGWNNQGDIYRVVCSRWKGFRHLAIDDAGDLILCLQEENYNKRKENEITFEEFKEMVEPKQEPKKTLYQKETYMDDNGMRGTGFKYNDVKEALKEFLNNLKSQGHNLDSDSCLSSENYELAKEIFGRELLE